MGHLPPCCPDVLIGLHLLPPRAEMTAAAAAAASCLIAYSRMHLGADVNHVVSRNVHTWLHSEISSSCDCICTEQSVPAQVIYDT